MTGADIVKGSERVSSLGAHRFILFGVLHPPHQRFGVLFAFGVHFFKAVAVLGQGGHSLGAVRGDDADKALSLQLPRPLDSRVVLPCPAAQPLGCSGVMRLQQVCQMLVPGITTHQPDGLGQDESHPVAAVGKGPFQRDGVGQAAIKIRHAVDDAGLVDDRDAAGRHEDAVVVRVEVCLGEILRLAVLCISGHHAELCRAAGKRRVIQRILAACIAEGAVDIAQIEIGVLADEVVHAHVLPAEGVFIVKGLVPPMLACQIGRHIGAARRNADAEIEAEVLLQAAVQHASAVNAPQAATHIDDTVFHGLFLHRLIPFPSQYNGTAGNTH